MRALKNNFFIFISYAATALTILALLFILGGIAVRGVPSISLSFLLTPESETPGLGGGIANAIVGTFILSIASPLLASPFAVGTAVYMKKYAKNRSLINAFSFFIDVLSGTPSVVIGIFGLLFLAFTLRYYTGGMSLISAIIALAILILPVIERSTEEAISNVPKEYEEASYALGATKWQTISKVTLPAAVNGIVTGIVLSVGRAAEESAVVILTTAYTQFLPEFKILPSDKLIFGIKIYPFQDIIAALPITVYNTYQNSHMIDQSEGFAAAFVLIVIVLIINTLTRLLVWKRRIG